MSCNISCSCVSDFLSFLISKFSSAVGAFIGGKWGEAKRMLEDAMHEAHGEDHFASQLLKYMERSNFKAPPKWRGHRMVSRRVETCMAEVEW